MYSKLIKYVYILGLLQKSQLVYEFDDQIRIENINANKMTVLSQEINRIRLDRLLSVSSSNTVSGSKTFKDLNITEIKSETLNNIPLSLMDPSAANDPLELAEGFEFQGDINLNHLIVKSINGFNVSAILQNVFLQNQQNTIQGNYVVKNVTAVKSLAINAIMDTPVDSLMTASTDQIMMTNFSISKFHVTTLISNLTNNEKLKHNVALKNEVNVIEGKIHVNYF